MLRGKADELGRLPRKSDFEPADTSRIKEKLGPWPRALESAGLKPVTVHRIEKQKAQEEKRVRRKERRHAGRNTDERPEGGANA